VTDQSQISNEPKCYNMIFGFGQVIVMGGTSGGSPSIGLKKVENTFKVGESIGENVDMSMSQPEVVLRFFTKEALGVFKKSVDHIYENFEKMEKPEKTMVWQVCVEIMKDKDAAEI
jgi:hypothetical protein